MMCHEKVSNQFKTLHPWKVAYLLHWLSCKLQYRKKANHSDTDFLHKFVLNMYVFFALLDVTSPLNLTEAPAIA